MFNFNQSKLRCRNMHWMSEAGVWAWHIVFTDRMSTLTPKHSQTTCCYPPQTTTAANRRSACSQIHMPSEQL